MAICITGMHRSGTSMITRLLHLSGLYLGDESELFEANQYNQEGYWENSRFVFLNNRILKKLGGSWHSPPDFPPDWESDPEMLLLLEEAFELVDEFQSQDIWGWKDPRNSFTIPFWKKILPDLKLIICVRNPLEVAQSLFKRDSFPESKSLMLWSKSYQSLFFHSKASRRIVTHYELYHEDAPAELQRLLSFIGISAPPSKIEEAVSTINPDLRHSYHTLLDLEQRYTTEDFLKTLYLEEGGSSFSRYLADEMTVLADGEANDDLSPIIASLSLLLKRAEIEAKLTETEAKLTEEMERRARIEEELGATKERQWKVENELKATKERQWKIEHELKAASEKLIRVEEEFKAENGRQESEIKALLTSVQAANQEISSLRSELTGIKSSLVWRVAKKLPGSGSGD